MAVECVRCVARLARGRCCRSLAARHGVVLRALLELLVADCHEELQLHERLLREALLVAHELDGDERIVGVIPRRDDLPERALADERDDLEAICDVVAGHDAGVHALGVIKAKVVGRRSR